MAKFKKFTTQKYSNAVFTVKNQFKKYFDIGLSKDHAKTFVNEDIFIIVNDDKYMFANIDDQKLLKKAKINDNVILKYKNGQLWYCVNDSKSHYWARLK